MRSAPAKPKGLQVEKDKLAPPRSRAWTRVEDYILSLARLRTSRRRYELKPRTQPDEPRLALSTLPFLALIGALFMLMVVIALAAWPGRERPLPKPQPEVKEQGTAPAGWFDDAKRDFKRS